MIRTIDDFATLWMQEAESTSRILNALTDASLSQAVTADHRTLGRLGWHLAITPKEMMERTGLHVEGPAEHTPVPGSAKTIADAYAATAKSLLEAIRKDWTEATLSKIDEMYGQKWSRGTTLHILVLHQSHHRGQMTVLMRQAGLRVPGVVGPAKEDWAAWKMEPPAI